MDKLNEERPEVRTGKACRHGQIPESPEEVVESLVQRVNRGRCRFERGNSSVNLNRREELKNTTNVVGETYGDFLHHKIGVWAEPGGWTWAWSWG